MGGLSKTSRIESPSLVLDQLSTIPPSPQEILSVEQELIDCMRKKKLIDRQLLDLEVQLYNYETSYFEKYPNGNLLKGFDTFQPSGTVTTAPLANGVSQSLYNGSTVVISDEDRLFSNSSLTFQKALSLKEKMVQKMMRQQQHPESEDFMLEEDDTAHQQHKRNVAPANSLSKKLQKNKDAAAAGHVKKSPLFHHVPPGSPSSHNSIMDSKKMLRIRTRINHIED